MVRRSARPGHSSRDVMRTFFRALWFFLFAVVFTVMLVYGLRLGDFWETLSNGAMICLTCIGVA